MKKYKGIYRADLLKRLRTIKKRCYNSKDKDYHNYGGRGIVICDEWLNNKEKFISWSVENGFKDNLSIDRINVNGNYSPENCRWVNMKTQNRNMRKNIYITAFGETKLLVEWAEDERCETSEGTLRSRISRGYKPELAITKPSSPLQKIKIYKVKTIDCKKSRIQKIYNTHYEAFGTKKSLIAWSKDKRCKVSLIGLYRRIKNNWNIEAAISIGPDYKVYHQNQSDNQKF